MTQSEKKLKIGYLTSSLSNFDGWGRYSRSLIESVGVHADVRALTETTAQNLTEISQVHTVLPSMRLNIAAQVRVFLAVLRHLRGCDVIHSLVEPYAPGAALAARLMGARFVMTLHGTYAVPARGLSMSGLLMRFALKASALTTTGSRYTEVKARRRVKFGECRFIPNGVDPREFHHTKAVREDFILTVGWLKPRKGMDAFIQAFGLIQKRYSGLTCVLAGAPENESFYAKLQELAIQTGVPDRVRFLGRVSDEELLKLYNTCRVFVFPARDIHENFEGFPMVFYEANACGAPVVTTRGFGSEYAIREGRNGLLVQSDDVQGTADAVARLLDDRELYERMHNSALETAGEHTWDRIAAGHLIPFYRDALTYKI